ncbi:MAG: DUF1592 domain-containing protein [Rubripirellula sp.]
MPRLSLPPSILVVACLVLGAPLVFAFERENSPRRSLQELKAAGAATSKLKRNQIQTLGGKTPEPRLREFRAEIAPALKQACASCHGADTQEANFRVDTLDPNLLHGADVDWWLEVVQVLSNGEMPPEDSEELSDQSRGKIVDWLSTELQVASQVRRSEKPHSSFRRMTRYEYNYALQDLLGLPFDFASDLPPETPSEDGFQNSVEVLQMSAMQFEYYRELARKALLKATVRGERPEPLYWNIDMSSKFAKDRKRFEKDHHQKLERLKDDPEKRDREIAAFAKKHQVNPSLARYRDTESGLELKASWRYSGAKYAWTPTTSSPAKDPADSVVVAIIPARQKIVVELGNLVSDTGTLRLRARASRSSTERVPSLRLEFGHQASNNSSAEETVSQQDTAILATSDEPEFYQWDVALSEIIRNPMRKIAKMGDTPNPSEYLKIYNTTVEKGDVQIDYLEVTAPVYDQWPPQSHTRIFFESTNKSNETKYAREIVSRFMTRAWRREVTPAEVDQKMRLFESLLPTCTDFQEAVVETLATVLSSPKFLYLSHSQSQPTSGPESSGKVESNAYELATRLSFFLWCSGPDQELLELAADGSLGQPDVLLAQTERMLADSKCSRFSKHFVRGWLGLQLLDYLSVDKKVYPRFHRLVKEAMQREPIELFEEVLDHNHSVIDFLHADYAIVNERLAKHYGFPNVYGNHFRKVVLEPDDFRGGLLTVAGLLAMNSDGKDSHPLKRGIWLLESLLNDPPPPPPPAVPEIDLADPEIAKMTLKERIEDHRNHAACMSCHAKIDPWGISFENYDAIGRWRDTVNGAAVDATSVLPNERTLDGVEGLKRYLLESRQDQFARAMVHKMATYALGRPLTFGDRAQVDQIAAQLRQQGDGLATLVKLMVSSDLFLSN